MKNVQFSQVQIQLKDFDLTLLILKTGLIVWCKYQVLFCFVMLFSCWFDFELFVIMQLLLCCYIFQSTDLVHSDFGHLQPPDELTKQICVFILCSFIFTWWWMHTTTICISSGTKLTLLQIDLTLDFPDLQPLVVGLNFLIPRKCNRARICFRIGWAMKWLTLNSSNDK